MHAIIVVPCYNEEHRLDPDAFLEFGLDDATIEFCFVDDGSSDGTAALLESMRARGGGRVSVLKLEKNCGKAEAVRRGVVAALEKGPDLVGFWDADLATPLSEIAAFLEVFRERPEIGMVMASRVRLLGRDIRRRASRHYVGRVGATLISISLGLAVYDTQCGAKMFRASDTVRAVFARPFLSRWIFDVEIIARLIEIEGRAAAAAAICEIPIGVWHDVRGSKVKSTDFLRALRDLWKIHRSYARKP
ncbi:MAG TPA: glycosyltransferase [Thermoanaerobaculia bacterium]|nr:glycosyltransferase [Thermoanaerobaculia bacterium]